MNILAPLKGRSPVGVDERLFLIDTLDSCVIGSSKHFKAEQIVIEKEITQDEIIQYYLDHPELKPNIREDLWNEFCNDKIQPYVYVKEEKEIEKTTEEEEVNPDDLFDNPESVGSGKDNQEEEEGFFYGIIICVESVDRG